MELQKKALAEQREVGNPRTTSDNSSLIIKLQREIKSLKDTRHELEEQMSLKALNEAEKEAEISQLKKDHEAEINRLVKEQALQGNTEARAHNDALNETNNNIINEGLDTLDTQDSKESLLHSELSKASTVKEKASSGSDSLKRTYSFDKEDGLKKTVTQRMSAPSSTRGSRESINSISETEVSRNCFLHFAVVFNLPTAFWGLLGPRKDVSVNIVKTVIMIH